MEEMATLSQNDREEISSTGSPFTVIRINNYMHYKKSYESMFTMYCTWHSWDARIVKPTEQRGCPNSSNWIALFCIKIKRAA